MPIVREFRGKKVKRTRKIGDRIVVTFQGAREGLRGDQIIVDLAEFLAERHAEFRGGIALEIKPNS